MPSHVLAPGSGRRLLSGRRTRWLCAPVPLNAGDQVRLCHGSIGGAERVYSRTAARGRGFGAGVWRGWTIVSECYRLITETDENRVEVIAANPLEIESNRYN